MADVPAHVVAKELTRYKESLIDFLELNRSLMKLLEEKRPEKLIEAYKTYIDGSLWILKRANFSVVEHAEEYKANLILAADRLSTYLSLSTEERQGKDILYKELLDTYLTGSKLLIEAVSWPTEKEESNE